VLIGIEANPRNKGNGGSSAVDRCLSHIRFAGFDPWHSKGTPKSAYKLRETFEALELLFKAGARWSPDDASSIKSVRRDLLGYESRATVDFLTLLVKHTACDRSFIEALLSSPQMKQHLSSEHWKMARLGLKDTLVIKNKRGQFKTEVPRTLLARYDRQELYQKVWSQPMRIVAREFGISDVALAKTCRKLLIPVPSRGYWAKRHAGIAVPKPPKLPTVDGIRNLC
jgi:hypothetical protein